MIYVMYAAITVALNFEAPQAGLLLLPFIPEYTIELSEAA